MLPVDMSHLRLNTTTVVTLSSKVNANNEFPRQGQMVATACPLLIKHITILPCGLAQRPKL